MAMEHILRYAQQEMIRQQNRISIKTVYVSLVERRNRKSMNMYMENRSLSGLKITRPAQQYLPVKMAMMNKR